jgi:outer membrane protein TolC
VIRNHSRTGWCVSGLVQGSLIVALCVGASSGNLFAQGVSTATPATPSAAAGAGQVMTTLPALSSENPFQGSIPQGKVVPGTIPLTLLDALDRGLKYNLGLYESSQESLNARALRLRSLSKMLPDVGAVLSDSQQQINLAAFGFTGSLVPGIPTIVGPFNIFTVGANVTGPVLDLSLINSYKASKENTRTAVLNYRNARELVVVAVGVAYLQCLSAQARVIAVQAETDTAQSLYTQAFDQHKAGVSPSIDVLRSQVELQSDQQRLVAAHNELDKQKLQLARTIGMPTGQRFSLAQEVPYTPAPPLTLEAAIDEALRNRPDYASALSAVRAAELQNKSARSERLPSLHFDGNYAVIGNYPDQSHGTFNATGSVQMPIFTGGRIRSDIQESEVALKQRQAEADDLRGRIEYEVRAAFLDLKAAADQVEVSRSTLNLAQETLTQGQDRFRAGVTNNIEVIQAQQSVVGANETLISSTLQFNLAKLALARSLGVAERATKEFLGGKP